MNLPEPVTHESLTKETAFDYAREHYSNPQLFHNEEFEEDMKIFYYCKKLLTRYQKGDSVAHHLTLNHIITLVNLFGTVATVDLLRYFIPKNCHECLNSFFFYLSILPANEENVKMDLVILDALKNI